MTLIDLHEKYWPAAVNRSIRLPGLGRVLVLFLASVPLLVGCDGAARPDNFPRLVSCSITVLNNGNPEAGVNVFLAPGGAASAGSGGNTDANGKAVIHTSQGTYSRKGAPIGDYTIVLNKTPLVPGAKSPEEFSKMDVDELEAYSREIAAKERALPKIIPEALTNSSTSPIKFTVDKAGAGLTIDIAGYFKE